LVLSATATKPELFCSVSVWSMAAWPTAMSFTPSWLKSPITTESGT